MCISFLKAEFTNEKLVLSSANTAEFATSKWGKTVLLLLWRVLVTALLIGSFIWYLLTFELTTRHLVFISNWSYIILMLYYIIATLVTIHHLTRGKIKQRSASYELEHVPPQSDGPVTEQQQNPKPDVLIDDEVYKMTCLHKLMWVLYNINLSITLVVTLLFWGILPWDRIFSHGVKLTVYHITFNTINSCFMIAENLLSSIPCHLIHFYHPLLFGVFYVLFVILLWAYDGTVHLESDHSIYPLFYLDDRPWVTVVAFVVVLLVLIPCGFVFHFCLYRLRYRLNQICHPNDNADDVVGTCNSKAQVCGVRPQRPSETRYRSRQRYNPNGDKDEVMNTSPSSSEEIVEVNERKIAIALATV